MEQTWVQSPALPLRLGWQKKQCQTQTSSAARGQPPPLKALRPQRLPRDSSASSARSPSPRSRPEPQPGSGASSGIP